MAASGAVRYSTGQAGSAYHGQGGGTYTRVYTRAGYTGQYTRPRYAGSGGGEASLGHVMSPGQEEELSGPRYAGCVSTVGGCLGHVMTVCTRGGIGEAPTRPRYGLNLREEGRPLLGHVMTLTSRRRRGGLY